MFFQTGRDDKRVMQFVDKIFLFRSKFDWIGGIDGREKSIAHRVFFPVYEAHSFFLIDMLYKLSVIHSPLWMAVGHLRLKFELYDADSLVHLRQKPASLLVVGIVVRIKMRSEIVTGIVSVGFHGECGQRHEIDSISFLKSSHIAVAQ